MLAKTSVFDSTHNEPTAFVKKIFTNFVETLGYSPPDNINEPRSTYPSLYSEFAAQNDGGKWFESLCQESATMGELSYPDHPPELQLLIARFTCFLIYLDDLGQKMPSSLEAFQKRLLTNETPDGVFLQAFRDHLTDMYKYWDTIPANCIGLSAMDFINGCLLEERPIIRDMELSDSAHSWPYYLRAKTGSAYAYAYMIFPMKSYPDMSVYIQVIEDITLFTNLTNDILSFYKEFLGGETNTYVYNRAHVSRKPLQDTLQDIVDDTLAAHDRISKTLQSTDAYLPWKRFVNGYLAFHFSLKRYRLSELGF